MSGNNVKERIALSRADYVCAACGEEQDTFLRPCDNCGSRKLFHGDFMRFLLGQHYRELLKSEGSPVH